MIWNWSPAPIFTVLCFHSYLWLTCWSQAIHLLTWNLSVSVCSENTDFFFSVSVALAIIIFNICNIFPWEEGYANTPYYYIFQPELIF